VTPDQHAKKTQQKPTCNENFLSFGQEVISGIHLPDDFAFLDGQGKGLQECGELRGVGEGAGGAVLNDRGRRRGRVQPPVVEARPKMVDQNC